MAENSKIEWTDHTFNPWIGCTKVSPACKNCYAERDFDHRYQKVKWGPNEDLESAMSESNAGAAKFEEWAIVDVMGHQRFIGRVSEQVVAGQGFVRIDVPETPRQKPWTKLVGTASIYAITPITEEIARAMAAEAQVRPINVFDLPEDFKPRLSHVSRVENEWDDDDGPEEPFPGVSH